MRTAIELLNALNSLQENINPTIIYNEGWMVRLLVIESMCEKLNIKEIDFGLLAEKKWSSEALISSPFVSANSNREGYTHADIILGDFSVDYSESGEVKLEESPKILGIIEAKMSKNLSSRTANAKEYNQASRNICCLAHVAKDYPKCDLFFIVVAPEVMIEKHKIQEQVDHRKISKQINDRFLHSGLVYTENIREQVKRCKVIVISYEEWIENIQNKAVKEITTLFYNDCIKHNRMIASKKIKTFPRRNRSRE